MVTPKKVRWGPLSTARINERLIPALRASERSSLVGVASPQCSKILSSLIIELLKAKTGRSRQVRTRLADWQAQMTRHCCT